MWKENTFTLLIDLYSDYGLPPVSGNLRETADRQMETM